MLNIAGKTSIYVRCALQNGLCVRTFHDYNLIGYERIPVGAIAEHLLAITRGHEFANLLSYRTGTWACAIRKELRAGNSRYFRSSTLERVLYRDFSRNSSGVSQRLDYRVRRTNRWRCVRSAFAEKSPVYASFY